MTDWNEGQILFDDLRLEKAIGQGAFGEVWRARQLSWGRDVAVKRVSVPDERRIRSLEQEAIHWLEIGLHPYVTTCYYTRRHEGAPVIVLEYASEGALDGWIKDERLLFEENAVEQILKFSLEAAWGLACAHRTGLLHLDVKPANILVEGGAAKITDFGIASQLGREAASPGTRAFASPEQLSLEGVSEKSDVFSWAVTVFVLFRHEASWAVGIAAPEVLEDEWQLGELPLEMPESVYRLLLECMAEEPEERPSMVAAADTLHKILQSEFPAFDAPAKTVDRQPLTAAEYNNRAVYMYETGDLDKADEYFRIAAETAADVTVPLYNKGLADYYAGRLTPAQLVEERLNKGVDKGGDNGPGAPTAEHAIAGRLYMLNGDARSIADNPGVAAASPAAQAWLAGGAPGALAVQEPRTAAYMKPDDRENIRKILTQGGVKANNPDPHKIPVGYIVSPGRDAVMLANDKGAILIGGLGPGGAPWTTCMLVRDKLTFFSGQFLGENAFYYLDKGIKICDFSDPGNLVFSGMPKAPEFQALGKVLFTEIECLDNVSCILCQGIKAGLAVVILDLTDGVSNARMKVVRQKEWIIAQGGMEKYRELSTIPSIAFYADGSVLIGGGQIGGGHRVSPEEWGGSKRDTGTPDALMPSNTPSYWVGRIAGSYGTGLVILWHSPENHPISSGTYAEVYEYACLWRTTPYRFVVLSFDCPPTSGGSVLLENNGEFLVTRFDKGDTPPPGKAEWLMMKAVSGAEAKERRDAVRRAEEVYDGLLASGDYGGVLSVAEGLRPLLESRDENALALWQRISRDFPRGKPLFAAESEAVIGAGETALAIKHPKPGFPGAPFSKPSGVGKIRFHHDYTEKIPKFVVANGSSPPRAFSHVGPYRTVVCTEGSDDGLFHALVYVQTGEDGKLMIGRKGILVRVVDAAGAGVTGALLRGPECVLEIIRDGLQLQEAFLRWSYHTLYLFLGGEGLFAIDFDSLEGAGAGMQAAGLPNTESSTAELPATELPTAGLPATGLPITELPATGLPITELPSPLIPDIISIKGPALLGEHADGLFTGENRWRLCFDILPLPDRPLSDPRLASFKGMLPKKPEEKRAMLLRNGFGNLWTEMILKKE